MLGDHETTTRAQPSSQDAAERLGLEIDSLIKSIDNDLTKFKDDFTQDLDPAEASAQADEAMAQALLDGELKPNVDPTATGSPVEVVANSESDAGAEADPSPAADGASDSEAVAERVLEDISEAATTSTPAVPTEMVDPGETSDAPAAPEARSESEASGDAEIAPPSIDPPADEPPAVAPSADIPPVETQPDEAGNEAAVSDPTLPNSDTEAVEETPAAPTTATASPDSDSADSSLVAEPAAANADDNSSSLADTGVEVMPGDQDSVPTVAAPLESEVEATTSESVPAADLEQLDRMLADAADDAAAAGDSDAAVATSADQPPLAPSSSFDDSSDHNLDPSAQPTSAQTSEETPATGDSTVSVDTTAVTAAASPQAVPASATNVADADSSECGVSPAEARESKICLFIAELKDMLWTRIPSPVQGFLAQALKVYQAIPYREKPAEWLFFGLAQINRPWQKLSADLQFGLLTISIASVGLSIVALAIVWMRRG